MSNIPENHEYDLSVEESLSPEEQIALAEARDNDMDDDSDELPEHNMIDRNYDVEPGSEQEEYEATN